MHITQIFDTGKDFFAVLPDQRLAEKSVKEGPTRDNNKTHFEEL